MVLVKKINVEEFNLINEMKNKKNIDMQKCLELLSDIKDITDLLPKKSKMTVSFELLQTNADIANGIRRCLVDELEIKSFDFDEYNDIDTSDRYILCDFIKKQIDLLPINQEYDYTGVNIMLMKENNTDEIIDVTSDDFIISGEAKQKDLEKIVSGNIVICKLRPGEYIKINNIKICSGINRDNGAKFNSVSNITYKILDADPIVETRIGKTGVSSMLSNPKHFFISYSTHRNIENPLKFMVLCCVTLITRLENILKDMKNITNSDTEYFSKLLTLETTGDLKKVHIKGEYWTIINMICRYCYILTDSNIKFVSASHIHPEKEVGVVNIRHPEFSTLIQNSIKKIISELIIIKAAFS